MAEPETVVLVGGPQDGARVCCGGGMLPPSVHVGPRYLGDGYAAWSREPCERFPAAYLWDGVFEDGKPRRFLFARWQVEPNPQTDDEPSRG